MNGFERRRELREERSALLEALALHCRDRLRSLFVRPPLTGEGAREALTLLYRFGELDTEEVWAYCSEQFRDHVRQHTRLVKASKKLACPCVDHRNGVSDPDCPECFGSGRVIYVNFYSRSHLDPASNSPYGHWPSCLVREKNSEMQTAPIAESAPAVARLDNRYSLRLPQTGKGWKRLEGRPSRLDPEARRRRLLAIDALSRQCPECGETVLNSKAWVVNKRRRQGKKPCCRKCWSCLLSKTGQGRRLPVDPPADGECPGCGKKKNPSNRKLWALREAHEHGDVVVCVRCAERKAGGHKVDDVDAGGRPRIAAEPPVDGVCPSCGKYKNPESRRLWALREAAEHGVEVRCKRCVK